VSRDRWLIASYIRVLQYSQNAPAADVPADRRAELDAPPRPAEGAAREAAPAVKH